MDYEEALNIRSLELEETNRSLAGLHMNLANCCFFKGEQDAEKGLLHYTAAQRILQNKVIQMYSNLLTTKKISNLTVIENLPSITDSKVDIKTINPTTRTKYSTATQQIFKSINSLSAADKAVLGSEFSDFNEFNDLIAELEERIVDVMQQIEKSKNPAIHEETKENNQLNGNHQTGFAIPQLNFGVNSNSAANADNQAENQAPVTLLTVKRKASATNPSNSNESNETVSLPAVKRKKVSNNNTTGTTPAV